MPLCVKWLGLWPSSGPSNSIAQPPLRPRHRRSARHGGAEAGAGDTTSARFLALVTEHHGPLAAIPLDKAAKIAAALAPQADLNTGAARTVLRRAVLAARTQTGEPS